MSSNRNYYREYLLELNRKRYSEKRPLAHQIKALNSLSQWYDSNKTEKRAGGILVLPTGGGKTFVAMRFLCERVLSNGYKVLWLAHTHHLLEQAYNELENHLGKIGKPRRILRVRVVSGLKEHHSVTEIKSLDDVVIATLQSIANAYDGKNSNSLAAFLESSKGKLCLVFDEAHHAPAPSYRRLIANLQEKHPHMLLVGLTATPTYTNEKTESWLGRIFPQGIIYQIPAQELIATGILARPKSVQMATNFSPNFEIEEYEKWIKTFRDLPENIIAQLAESQERNEYIAETYWKNRDNYGKTIIFTDRWYQCESICESLIKRGIRAACVYTQSDCSLDSKIRPKKRTNEENIINLERFREGKIDVILNVRMLTEGTDVPDINSCFITRQTTSKILLTQMIGRALRGPEIGGTSEANLVFFTDNWQQLIKWAEYEQLISGEVASEEDEESFRKRSREVQIPIDLVRLLSSQMHLGSGISPRPFKTLMPVGWYLTEFSSVRIECDPINSGSFIQDEVEAITYVVLVFEHEVKNFENLVAHLEKIRTGEGIADDSAYEEGTIYRLRRKFFADIKDHFGSDLNKDIFNICRHFAHNDFAPRFFDFENRMVHDLEAIAKMHIDRGISTLAINAELDAEYSRNDRYWRLLYPTFDDFRDHYYRYSNNIVDTLNDNEININNSNIKYDNLSPQKGLISNNPIRSDQSKAGSMQSISNPKQEMEVSKVRDISDNTNKSRSEKNNPDYINQELKQWIKRVEETRTRNQTSSDINERSPDKNRNAKSKTVRKRNRTVQEKSADDFKGIKHPLIDSQAESVGKNDSMNKRKMKVGKKGNKKQNLGYRRDLARLWFREGKKSFKAGRYQEALKSFEYAIQFDPYDNGLIMYLWETRRILGKIIK